jgi:choline dehydrogenase-like flavoprotein
LLELTIAILTEFQLQSQNEAFRRPEGSRFDNTYDPAVHGFEGPIGNSLVEDDSWITEPTLTGAEQVGIPYNRDVNSGQPLGINWQQYAVQDGARSSAATGYINAQDRARNNLRVLLNSRVSRVLPRPGGNSTSGPLHFTTVEYTDGNGSTYPLECSLVTIAWITDKYRV